MTGSERGAAEAIQVKTSMVAGLFSSDRWREGSALPFLNIAELYIVFVINSPIKAGIYTKESLLILEALHTSMQKSMQVFAHNHTHGSCLFQ